MSKQSFVGRPLGGWLWVGVGWVEMRLRARPGGVLCVCVGGGAAVFVLPM